MTELSFLSLEVENDSANIDDSENVTYNSCNESEINSEVFLVEKVDGVDKGKYYAMKVLKKARLICSEKDKAHTASERNILEMLKLKIRAPEIIRCKGHGKPVDWWSLGTLLYDMLSGGILTAPLKIPVSFSPEASQLIRGLLKRDYRERLGSRGGVEEIKCQKFFCRYNINWSDVFHRRLRPPFKPKLSSDSDVSMFDPYFTHLQPVVSPADCSRPIPPDMFQGFSYVAPSVCEKEMGDAWSEPPLSGTQWRRHFGTRGASSAGRLQRLGVASATYGVHIPLPTAKPDLKQSIQVSKEYTPGERAAIMPKVMPPSGISAISCIDSLNLGERYPDTSNLTTGNSVNYQLGTQADAINTEFSQVNPCFKKPRADDDEDDGGNGCDNDEDDEIEDEDIPGAKQIFPFTNQPSCVYVAQPLASSTFSSHLDTQKVDRRPAPSSLLPSKSTPCSMSYTSIKSTKSHLTASPLSHTSVRTATSSKRNFTNGVSMTFNSHRRVMAVPLTSSPGVAPSAANTSGTTSSSSGSKCIIM